MLRPGHGDLELKGWNTMASENPFMKHVRERGWIDEREIAFAVQVRCTEGRKRVWWGGVWFFLSGSRLRMYEMVGLTQIGALADEVDLMNARFVRGSSFPLHTTMRFECGGRTYAFQGFAQAKRVIGAVKESCGA